MDISSLIPMLRSHGVTRFKGYGIEVELSLHKEADFQVSSGPTGLTPILPGAFKEPEEAPIPAADDTMAYEQVLNWSAPGSNIGEAPEPPSLPLTGEDPSGMAP